MVLQPLDTVSVQALAGQQNDSTTEQFQLTFSSREKLNYSLWVYLQVVFPPENKQMEEYVTGIRLFTN